LISKKKLKFDGGYYIRLRTSLETFVLPLMSIFKMINFHSPLRADRGRGQPIQKCVKYITGAPMGNRNGN
jgi:hypothetical protein